MNKKKEGYALVSVLTISLVVTGMVFLFLSFIQFINIYSLQKIKRKKAELTAFSAIERFMPETGIPGKTSTFTIEPFNIRVNHSARGLINRFDVQVTRGEDTTNISADYLPSPDSLFGNALTLTRPNFRGTLAGKNKIEGKVALTRKRIFEGNLQNISRGNRNDIYDNLIVDKNLRSDMFPDSLLSPFFEKDSLFKDGKPTYIEQRILYPDSKLRGRFFEFPQLDIKGLPEQDKKAGIFIHSYGDVTISEGTDIYREMNILCSSKLVIEKNVRLRNAVFATVDSIIINGGEFKNCQFISKTGIRIKDAFFNFPTIICLSNDNSDSSFTQNDIRIYNSIINGSILHLNSVTGLPGNKSTIFIDKESKAHGIIYSENNCELRGAVFGSVYTYNLYYVEDKKEYINWFVNLEINRNKLDPEFLAPAFFNNNKKLKLVKYESY